MGKVAMTIVLLWVFALHIESKPFLYNTISLFATSSPQKTAGNIADLRRAKAEQLEEEKKSFFDDNPTDGEMNNNEVNPDIVQKKLAKIFAKLQLLSGLSSSQNTTQSTADTVAKKDEEVTEAEEVTEESKKDELKEEPSALSRIVGSIVNLTYRMLSIPFNRSSNS